jgi:hypothetical protein
VSQRRQRPQDPAGAAAELKDRRARPHGRVHDLCFTELRQQRVELDRAPVVGYRARPGAHLLIHAGGTQLRLLTIPSLREVLVDAEDAGLREPPVPGAVSAPAAVLIRPDGYVAWAGDPAHPALPDALTSWFGPAAAVSREGSSRSVQRGMETGVSAFKVM